MSGRRRSRGRAFFLLGLLAATAGLHELACHVLADLDIVETLLAGGGAAGVVAVTVAVLFLLLRLFVILVVPGLALVAIGWAILGRS